MEPARRKRLRAQEQRRKWNARPSPVEGRRRKSRGRAGAFSPDDRAGTRRWERRLHHLSLAVV